MRRSPAAALTRRETGRRAVRGGGSHPILVASRRPSDRPSVELTLRGGSHPGQYRPHWSALARKHVSLATEWASRIAGTVSAPATVVVPVAPVHEDRVAVVPARITVVSADGVADGAAQTASGEQNESRRDRESPSAAPRRCPRGTCSGPPSRLRRLLSRGRSGTRSALRHEWRRCGLRSGVAGSEGSRGFCGGRRAGRAAVVGGESRSVGHGVLVVGGGDDPADGIPPSPAGDGRLLSNGQEMRSLQCDHAEAESGHSDSDRRGLPHRWRGAWRIPYQHENGSRSCRTHYWRGASTRAVRTTPSLHRPARGGRAGGADCPPWSPRQCSAVRWWWE